MGKYSYPIQDMESVTTSLTKYTRHVPDYDRATWTSAWGITSVIVNEQLRGGTIRKYTLQEAISIMDGSKATGWPLCNWYPTKQLAWESEKFQQSYNLFDDALYSGLRTENFDTVFLKDEMRPINKCGSGSARMVFVQDVVSATWGVQHGKMFDQRIIANVQETIIGGCAIAVGMTPFSNTFQLLTEKFKDCVCFELDGKAWDSNMFPDVHRENAKIRCKAYGYDEKTTQAVYSYYGQVSHTTAVLPDGTLRYRMSGNPSGQANTTIDNSMWTMSAFIYGLIRTLLTFLVYVTSDWFKENVRLIVFGDDIIFGLLKSFLSHHNINPLHFIERFQIIQNQELGLTYTASMPSPLTDLNWLNFSWKFDQGRWWPILDPVKILNSLHVVREQRNQRNTLERAISIRNISFGDKILFAFIDSYICWMISQYGVYDLNSSILSTTELYNLFTGSEVLKREFDWEHYADPMSLHKTRLDSGMSKPSNHKKEMFTLSDIADMTVNPRAKAGNMRKFKKLMVKKTGRKLIQADRKENLDFLLNYKKKKNKYVADPPVPQKKKTKARAAKLVDQRVQSVVQDRALVPYKAKSTPTVSIVAKRAELKSSGDRVGISAPTMHMRPNKAIVRNHIQKDRVYVGALKGSDTLAAGQIMFSRRNRASLPGSYLQPLSGMYTRWRVRKQTYFMEPSVGSTFAGQIIMAQDPDPISVYNDPTTAIQSLSVLPGNSIQQAWRPSYCHMPHTKEHDQLFTQDVDTTVDDYTERFSSAGNLFIACVAVGDMKDADTTIGSVWLDYEYEFYEPRLQLNLMSDPTYILRTLTAATIEQMVDTGDVDAPGIMQKLMHMMLNDINLTITVIQSIYDAVVTVFDFLPYVFGAINNFSDISNRTLLSNGAGVAPTEQPGFGIGHYKIVYKVFMTSVLFDLIHSAISADGAITPVERKAYATASYDFDTNVASTGAHAPAKWMTSALQTSGDTVVNCVTYNAYSGKELFQYIGTGGVFSTSLRENGYNIYNDLDGIFYDCCWKFELSFSIVGGRGWADKTVRFANDFPDASVKTAFYALLRANPQHIVTTTEFTNKESNIFLSGIAVSSKTQIGDGEPFCLNGKSQVNNIQDGVRAVPLKFSPLRHEVPPPDDDSDGDDVSGTESKRPILNERTFRREIGSLPGGRGIKVAAKTAPPPAVNEGLKVRASSLK